jgi:hypothetical protein
LADLEKKHSASSFFLLISEEINMKGDQHEALLGLDVAALSLSSRIL